MGRPLSLEVGQEGQPAGSRRLALRLRGELLVGRIRRECIAEPAQGARGIQHHAHRLPGVGNGVAEGVHPRLRIVHVLE